MKIFSVVGARPQFIKAAMISRAIREAGHEEFLLHTGQHYDEGLSKVFFDELEIRSPDINLEVGSGSHGWQTGQMLIGIENVLMSSFPPRRPSPSSAGQKPDWVLVYGDTNSTLAGALAAVKMCIPVAHVEAGLRSYNRMMPEEHNRVLTDHCADILFCPTQTAVDNLASEGRVQGVYLVGDVMLDAARHYDCYSICSTEALSRLNLTPKDYLLATLHRPHNTDDPTRLKTILSTLNDLDEPVVFPLHPRTRQKMDGQYDHAVASNIIFIPPLGYLDMLVVEKNARLILTDSGGVQKEAFFFAVPCLTLRTETEWPETVRAGWNRLVDADPQRIMAGVKAHDWPDFIPDGVFGDGAASQRIIQTLEKTIIL